MFRLFLIFFDLDVSKAVCKKLYQRYQITTEDCDEKDGDDNLEITSLNTIFDHSPGVSCNNAKLFVYEKLIDNLTEVSIRDLCYVSIPTLKRYLTSTEKIIDFIF